MRRTGKTFRVLVEAMKKASEGNRVVLECSNHPMAEWTFNKACEMVSPMILPKTPKPRTLIIGDGEIIFTSKKGAARRERNETNTEYLFDYNQH